MKALVPHRFTTTTARNLDMEKVNDNLETIATDVNRNLDNRYTYSTLILPLDGVTNASTDVIRRIPVRRPLTTNGAEVCFVEAVVYAAGTEPWTVSCSDTTWPSIIATSAGATTEAYASSNVPVPVPVAASPVVFTISATNASTITRGFIIVHLRCDRGNQGTSHAGYTPTLLDCTSSTAGSLLDTQLTAAATAVTNDTTNDVDLRCEIFAVRNLGAAASASIRLPTGLRRKYFARGYIVAAVGETTVFTFADLSGSVNFDVDGGGVTTEATDQLAMSGTLTDDPMTAASDMTVTITSGAVGSLIAYVLIWSS